MRNAILLIIAIGISFSGASQSFEKLKLTEQEIPVGYKISNEILCKSIQPKLLYGNPELYKSLLGSVKSKDFQSFESNKDQAPFFSLNTKVS